MLSIGIRSSSAMLSGEILEEKHLRLLKEYGFDLVELSFNSPYLGTIDDSRCGALRASAERMNLKYTAHAPDTMNLSSPDRNISNDSLEMLRGYIARAAACGAGTMVFHACASLMLSPGTERVSLANLTDALKRITELCESKNVKLAIETMIPGRLTSDVDTILKCVDDIGSPFIGICIDTNHVNLSESISSAINKASGRIFEFHLNDNHMEKEEHLLPFRGLIDWDEFAEDVAGIGYDGNMVMEPSLGPGEKLPDLLESARFTRETLLEKIKQFY